MRIRSKPWLLPMMAVSMLLASSEARSDTIKPIDARMRNQGNITAEGAFSFWTHGVLGEWFTAAEQSSLTLSVAVRGTTLKNEPPRLSVERLSADGEATPIGVLSISSGRWAEFQIPIPAGETYFGIRLRHTNRMLGQTDEQGLRHCLVRDFYVKGAQRADCGPNEYLFFNTQADHSSDTESHTVDTEHLRVHIEPSTGIWSATHKQTQVRIDAMRPVLRIRSLDTDLGAYTSQMEETSRPDHAFGSMRELTLGYKHPNALTVVYSLLISEKGNDIVARIDFENHSGHELTIHRVAPLVAGNITLGGQVDTWQALGDGKRFCDPHRIVEPSREVFNCWWHLALRNQTTRHSILFGALTNNKGIGRFLLMPHDHQSVRAAAYCDYENITMPAGAKIVGEPMLLHFGRTGNDSLERFGTLVALANEIDIDGGIPLDPYHPESAAIYNYFNSYGAGVVRGFPYQHDRSRGDKAFMDPAWTQANRHKMTQLRLHDFGYSPPMNRRMRGAPSPLVRRYGHPDFWFKEAQEIAQAHPEFYIDKRIDFSNPEVMAFERERVARAFQDKQAIIRYGWDFTDLWQKLPGQHDPFMTSAETYRRAMGIWRDAARTHRGSSHSNVCMNIVGFNYDRVDSLRIGADSDQGYYGKVCTFTQGLTRQASGRYFYNGKVWWNNADSFHVYCGGLYSYNQGKTHASFCAMAGNVTMVAEPFTDQEIPVDRLDIIRRVAPSTRDVAQAVDVFDHNPARLWNMPIERPFGRWNVVGLFNVDYGQTGTPITQQINMHDLGLKSDKKYLVYEFWTQRFLGTVQNSFTRTLQAPDCEVYAIVEKSNHPVLLSTSRHVRQMAYDVLNLKWDKQINTLSGVSKVVRKDPYQLRVYVPEGYAAKSVNIIGMHSKMNQQDRLLTVDFTSSTSCDVPWSIIID